MTPATVVVYAGPTISATDIHRVLPAAEIRPPAARGDLLARDWQPGDVAVLIDGYFRERRSVGHKEILRLIDAGVRVLGAASMGALRAAELAPCGMHGVGEVYEMYRSGRIDGDDEVGMLHGPAELGYPARTIALVNLRYGCDEGGFGPRIVAAAKAMAFMDRTWDGLAAAVEEPDRVALLSLEHRIASGEWDLKRRDALAALRVAAAPGVAPAARQTVPFAVIAEHQALDRRTRREYAPGRWMSDLDVLTAARLFDDDYPEVHERVLTGLLDGFAAAGGTSTADYAYAKLGVRDPLPDALAGWLTDAEMARLSPAGRITRVLVRVWPVWHSTDWRPAVLEALRDSQRWDEWCDLVARADEAAEQARFRVAVPPPAVCAQLFLRHWRGPGTAPKVEMARRGFSSPEELGGAVRRYFAYDMSRRGTR
ncbi:TfuA-like protein [Winogradskya consettensis]|uniref:TfuA-like core domain-containing protein n=1 Tax=Winogradskya consettensis TaxID=113560 RepID=A0A919SJ26_9ACTN|nr:TfuA-like protein [Actinoplanes consettensis]GIM73665.1 hypothetical protein Aco04nite_36460 [Actinoplanes consettensis]